MRIPPFWVRATVDGFEVPGWSFTSLEEAQRVAVERATLLRDVIENKQEPQGRYLYGDRPVREPVVETLGSRPDALITRNAYGALCLNTEDVAFIDVDGDDKLPRIKAAHAAHPAWCLRIYRTKAGFRVVALHARMAPGGDEAAALFEALGADPLYRKLCGTQQSFRARLTPKPWRIGQRKVPGTFPWRDSGVERAVASWVQEYETASRDFAVCQLVETLGTQSGDDVIAQVIALHDARVFAPDRPLA
jgi:hypothetical protein